MSTFQLALVGVYALILIVWVERHFRVSRTQRAMPILTLDCPGYRAGQPPLVSVLIPAKDEEGSIGECVRSVLNQSYRRLEVIVIDDRSDDGTARVVREIAARDPRVRLVSTCELPTGWTGKTNALATGVRQARGDWLLFIDSDTRHAPENLSIVLEYARRERADMVSILPRMRNGSFWERVVQPLAGMILMLRFPIERVNDDADPETGFANGQYILIRRHVYEAIGGHATVRDKFVEDIHLARLIKALRYRVRVTMAPELSSTRMYTSLANLVQGWSRILYAAYSYSISHLTAVLAGLVVFSLSAYAILAATLAAWFTGHHGPTCWTASGLCFIHLLLQSSVMVRAYSLTSNQRRYVAFYGVAAAVMFGVLVSALRKCLTHRIVWRGTCYDRIQDQDARPISIPISTAQLAGPPEFPLKQSA